MNHIYREYEDNIDNIIEEFSKIQIDEEDKAEIEKDEYYSIKNSGYDCYFTEEHLSTKEAYNDAKERCLKFLNEV